MTLMGYARMAQGLATAQREQYPPRARFQRTSRAVMFLVDVVGRAAHDSAWLMAAFAIVAGRVQRQALRDASCRLQTQGAPFHSTRHAREQRTGMGR